MAPSTLAPVDGDQGQRLFAVVMLLVAADAIGLRGLPVWSPQPPYHATFTDAS